MSTKDYVKSISNEEKFNNRLDDLKSALIDHNRATRVNNRELQKLNELAAEVQQEKIVKLEAEIRQMKEDAKWVKGEEPALDIKPDHLMKKLNVL